MLHLRAAAIGPADAPILRDIDVQVTAGERVVVLGPSGAGKTTLLNALYAAATRPGCALARRVALIPQPLGLVDPLRARHNVALGRVDRRGLAGNLRSLVWMAATERQAIAAVAQRLQVDDVLEQVTGTLSGGQRSRIAAARALYRGGELLLADEPCAALDPERAVQLMRALREGFATLICTMHDVDAGLQMATRVWGVSAGRLVFDLPPAVVDSARLRALYGAAMGPSPPVRAAEPPPEFPRHCL